LVIYLIFEVRMRILTYYLATPDIRRRRLQHIMYPANALVFTFIHSPHESGHIVSPHVCMVLLYPIFASRSQSTGECFVALLLALEVWNEPWFNVRKGKTSEAIKETARRWHRQLSHSSMRWLDGAGQRNSPGGLASCAYL
jgi:hypothetical protein